MSPFKTLFNFCVLFMPKFVDFTCVLLILKSVGPEKNRRTVEINYANSLTRNAYIRTCLAFFSGKR